MYIIFFEPLWFGWKNYKLFWFLATEWVETLKISIIILFILFFRRNFFKCWKNLTEFFGVEMEGSSRNNSGTLVLNSCTSCYLHTADKIATSGHTLVTLITYIIRIVYQIEIFLSYYLCCKVTNLRIHKLSDSYVWQILDWREEIWPLTLISIFKHIIEFDETLL